MYINKLEIEKYKIFENITIEFEIPKDNKNVVNVVAGINGCGKTTLLELLFRAMQVSSFFENENFKFTLNDSIIIDKNLIVQSMVETINGENNFFTIRQQLSYLNNTYEDKTVIPPRIIYLPSYINAKYISQSIVEKPKNTISSIFYKIDTSKILGNAEIYIKEYVTNKVFSSFKTTKPISPQEAIEEFNKVFEECDMITKLANIQEVTNRPTFETINKDIVTIDKLSSGEQQLYARVVSLMILNPQNSIILIDEPEIALHPKWQIEIMKLYSKIGTNNQFIIATHSPHIILNTHYKNIIFLVKEDNKIQAKKPIEPPRDGDINSVLEKYMQTNTEHQGLKKLHSEYKQLFDEGKEDTLQAKIIEKQIKEYESINSSFWQGIAFDKEMRD